MANDIENKRKLYGLDLFSGYGGISLALSNWVRPIAYCEIDRYARSILFSRMSEGALPIAPVWDDVQTLKRDTLPITPEIIYGGFPCQDISVAGHGKGLAGERSGLFYEIVRLTKEINPRFVFLENVAAIRTRGLHDVVRTFTEIGYDCRWTCLSARSVGANHKRERWFMLAYANNNFNIQEKQRSNTISERMESFDGKKDSAARQFSGASKLQRTNTLFRHDETNLAYANNQRLSNTMPRGFESQHSKSSDDILWDWWAAEPDVGRVANGVTNRVDRIKALGNGVVPAQAKKAFEKLIGLYD